MLAIAYPMIDPVAVQWGPLVVRWYALAYVAGILIGWRVMLALSQRPGRDGAALMSRAAVDDFVVWATLGIILGGRIGYILFYQPGFYLDHPMQVFELWHGGMSFHGGLIGVLTAIWLFARRRRIGFLTMGDLVSTVVPIGLFFGRIANFVNGELYGRPADVPWAMVFPRDPLQVPRHPSELYEALLEGVVLFCVLIWFVTRRAFLPLAGLYRGGVPHRLRHRAHHKRALPPARRAARLSGRRGDDGPAFVDPAAALRPLSDMAGEADGLAARLAARIGRDGPIGVDDYMRECADAYYGARDPFGAKGDFTTAPEITQAFGELVGLWAASAWQAAGAPDPVVLVELGPGRGTLMRDALRAAKLVPAFRRAVRLHLVEASPVLRAAQRAALAGETPVWHGAFDEVPAGPAILLANEFFDALPVRQFVRTPQGWRERRVGHDGAFRFVLGEDDATRDVPEALRGAPEGAIVETSPESLALAGAIARRIATSGGAALIVDFGPAQSGAGETLQAARRHRAHDVLADPGAADLAAHVDFAALARAAEGAGARAWGPVTQGALLQALGIELRAARLMAAAPDQAALVRSACRRLIDPAEMGTLFKALALTAPGAAPPAGFA